MDNKQKPQTFDFDYKGCSKDVLFEKFQTSASGLSEQEAQKRLAEYGLNEAAKKQKRALVIQFILKFFHPLVVLLLVIAAVSFLTGDAVSGSIIAVMAFMSVALGFFQEYRAGKEADRLSEMVRTTATVYRNGKSKEISIRQIVPGDIVDLFAGDMIPADIRIIQAKDLFVNQSALTGESMPVEKTPLTDSLAFMGSSVVSGTALAVVIKTGLATEFGEISKRLSSINQPTTFDRGINGFVWLMIRAMVVLVVVICAINYFTKGNLMEALLFSLAVAIGLTPEMLPMLVTINLSKGAIAMSKKDVIVKRLNSIQNFGAMDVLCTDKTGTLTLDKIVLEKYCDVVRKEDQGTLKLAYLNSYYQTGLKNILDKAVLKYEKLVVKQYKKIDEMPFDFSRRIMSVVVDMEGRHKIISKGAPEEILKRCKSYELDGELEDLDQIVMTDLKEEYDSLSADGFRVLAVAYKDMGVNKDVYSKDDERDLVLKGYIAFLDPPKPTARKTIEVLRKLGIELKVLTGDNDLVTKKICSEVGLDIKGLLTGEQLEKLTDSQLKESVKTTTVFARLSPIQKERVIHALHQNNHTVGYLGDGINDAPALKAADVGISVNNAVDIAKESADIILLQKNLMVLRDGVLEGRRVFGNIFKYIKMGSSSNFGNMFSMTGASFLLPFLPMYPIQIILNNFLYDASQIAIPSDDVDEDYLLKSRSWNIEYIKKFMMIFGPLSSVFDYLTFGVLIFIFHANQNMFATSWFLESMCTQTLVIHIIRTGKIPFIESWPSPFLIFTSIYIVSIALVLPYTPLGAYFKFVMPPASFFLFLILIVGLYLWSVQVAKTWFIKKYGYE
jgi:Mg2+-importing ATPase